MKSGKLSSMIFSVMIGSLPSLHLVFARKSREIRPCCLIEYF